MNNSLQLKAYGKINLGLDVVRKREDGYHEVRMVMQTVKLYDKLTFHLLKDDRISIQTNLKFLPVNKDNLVYKAIKLLKDTYQIKQGMEIDLFKCIPVAAGMAGGSSDCAAALVGAAKLFGLHLSKEELMKLGVQLGADVPYCILRGTALSEGIGEILTPLPSLPDCHILIAKPPVSVSTKFVYTNLDANGITEHPDIDGIVNALGKNDLSGIANRLENVLETVTIPQYPVISDIKNCMIENGAMNALMSGSGPTVFGLFAPDQEANAEQAKILIRKKGLANQVYIVKPFNTLKKS